MNRNKNIYESLQGVNESEEPPKKSEGKWGIGTKKATEKVESKK